MTIQKDKKSLDCDLMVNSETVIVPVESLESLHGIKRNSDDPAETYKNLGNRVLNKLLFIEDLFKPEDFNEGYIIVKEDGLQVQGVFYDLAIGNMLIKPNTDKFYSVPIYCSVNVSNYLDITQMALAEFCETGVRRYWVQVLNEEKPILVDINFKNRVVTEFSTYFRTNSSIILKKCGQRGVHAIHWIDKIMNEYKDV